MATEALDPADHTGGVAYLWLTMFAAAGPAFAVPREPLTIDRDSCVAFTGAAARAGARLSAGALRCGMTVLQ